MRCTQIRGLSPAAYKYINKRVAIVPIKTCPECGHITGGNMVSKAYDTETGVKAGMFNDGPTLYEYTMKDGEVLREVIQAVPWSSGPCIFLCLQNEKGEKICKWPVKEIENC